MEPPPTHPTPSEEVNDLPLGADIPLPPSRESTPDPEERTTSERPVTDITVQVSPPTPPPISLEAALSHNYNHVPLHALPPELFVRILLLLLDFSTSTIYARLRIIAGVCRYWFDTVVSCPLFWSHFRNDIPLPTLDLFLKKSGKAPLDIHYHERSSPSSIDAFWDRLRPEFHRLDSFEYQVQEDSVPPAVRHDEDDADRAKRREISESSSLEVVCLFDGKPRVVSIPKSSPLRRVAFRSGRVLWDTCKLSNLHTLQIYDMTLDSGTLSFECLVGIVAMSPQLEILILCDIATHRDDTHTLALSPRKPIDDPFQSYTFPSPTLFGFTRIPEKISDYLLEHLQPTRYRHLCAHDAPLVYASPESPLSEAITYLLRVGRPIYIEVKTGTCAPKAPRIDIGNLESDVYPSHVYQDFWAYSTPNNTALGLRFKSPNVMDLLETLATLVAQATTEIPVELNFRCYDAGSTVPRPIVPTSVFQLLPNITSLMFRSSDIDVESVLLYISTPQTSRNVDGSASKHWPCPRLTSLRVEDWTLSSEATTAFVNSRWGDVQSGEPAAEEPNPVAEGPPKLTYFRFSSSSRLREDIKAEMKPALTEEAYLAIL